MIFVGGSGRSGTTVLAQALQLDPRFAVFIEPKFVVNDGGLMDYAINKGIDRDTFVANMKKRFLPTMVKNLKRFDMLPNAESVYTSKLIDSIDFRTGSAVSSRDSYARIFTVSVLSEIYKHTDTNYLVYKSPHIILWAGYLSWIFPASRFVHILRDPRDVCASVLKRKWGPKTVPEFVSWYDAIMGEALLARASVPNGRYMTVSLEKFVVDPVATMTQLCRFIGKPKPSNKVAVKIEELVSPAACHRERYLRDLTEEEAAFVYDKCRERYSAWLDRSIV